MTLSAGARLGPYEILGPLGAGGMGEVYRARDPRLGREVAIKVLPASYSQDADRLRRFEQEAHAAGVLNHPNITALYDIGSAAGSPYVVFELLEGETLRSRIAAGDLSLRKAIDYGVQIARGLTAAHGKGIVHRDLKPENLFVTKDGRVKILDFGLAKLTHPETGTPLTEAPTETRGTEPGVMMGTVGYMSPEQVRGQAADQRSDLFAFGAILHEMLTGRRAFHGASAADTMSAILKEEPPDLSSVGRDIPPGLEQIVRHCLEKNPDERAHSAHDVAFDLEALSGFSGPRAAAVPLPAPRKRLARVLAAAASVILGLLLAGILVYRAGKRAGYVTPPSFHQVSFRRGEVGGAFFAPDGQTVIYSAALEGRPMEVFVTRPESPESRSFGLVGAEVLAMSRTGEMAVSLDRHQATPYTRTGRLARISIAGGAPRDILDDVQWADWSPDGQDLAIVRDVGAHNRLEFPIGKVIYETNGWISHPRFSPDGERIAFIDHPVVRDDGGLVAVVDRTGKRITVTPVYETAMGLAWAPGGREIWFTAAETGYNRVLYGADLSGQHRLIARVPGVSTIEDISKDGRVLLTNGTTRVELRARRLAEEKESELSWLDWSLVTDISPDGGTILCTEAGEGGGPGYSIYIRKTDGSPAVRLGQGFSHGFSPDGKWVLGVAHQIEEAKLLAVPTSVGQTRTLSNDGLHVLVADWLPDGKRIVMTATESGRGTRLYLRDFDGGKARPFSPEGYRQFERCVSPDGRFVVARGPDRRAYSYPLGGGEPTPLAELAAGDIPVRFDRDGRFLFIYRQAEFPFARLPLRDVLGPHRALEGSEPSGFRGSLFLQPVRTDGRRAGIRLQLFPLSHLSSGRRRAEMTLASGSRLGPYEILAPLGAGGMGEVYRAKDPRLGREVAIKVLPASYSQDTDRLKRFEQEARAAGVLNHPNITAVYDIGTHEGAPYVVSELLEGETLRGRLAGGALSQRKAVDFAIQIAHGLAAAHEKGIVHRDLKPENLFITGEGHVKILDFGLAKLTHPDKPGVPLTEIPTQTAGTEPGIVMGTAGYMSPEQVRGLVVDARSDIFAFGAVLYEMLSGQRAFTGDTAADTMTAILVKEPPDLSQKNREIPPGLERVVRHCLEKSVRGRFQSAGDVAFDLEALSGVSSGGTTAVIALAATRKGPLLPIFGSIALALGVAAGFFGGKRVWDRPPPSFHQITFRRGGIPSARFAPDGRTVFYSAAWEGRPVEVFTSLFESPESRPFGLPEAEVLGVSRSGELAVSLRSHVVSAAVRAGMLARMNVAGGSGPREILDDVQWADWAPDGNSLAVVREVGPAVRLEYPVGTVLYQTAGWISHPRVSPRGDRVAFLVHPIANDDGGTVAVVDRNGNSRTLSQVFESLQGLAWSPDGDEIWFTGGLLSTRDLYSVTLSGRERVRARFAGSLTLHDIARDGRILLVRETWRIGAFGVFSGDLKERDLSWLDWSLARDLSPDGKILLFGEEGAGGGVGYSAYIRQTDGSPAIRLGEGAPESLSPDGKWALTIVHPLSDMQLVAYPTGAGEPKRFPRDGLALQLADWTPDGREIVFSANEPERGVRIYVRDFSGGKPRAVSPEGYRMFRHGVSSDGRFVIAAGPDRRIYLYPLAGGEPTPLPGSRPGDIPDAWTSDGRAVYVHRRDQMPAKVFLLDVRTGKKDLWKELVPADAAGVVQVSIVLPTSDGRSCVYSYLRELSELYVVEGLK